LIADTCRRDPIKHHISYAAKTDFGWDNSLLGPYVLAKLMTASSTRVPGFLSSGEWLCGIFTSGENLLVEHIGILMSFVNPYVSNAMIINQQYHSGKDVWQKAPAPIKDILDLLDDSLLRGQSIMVNNPRVVPLNPEQSIAELEKIPLMELFDKVKIVWN